MSIPPKKREIKRYAYQKHRLPQPGKDRAEADSSTGTCRETAIVRCNQWECFTRHLCRE